MKTIELFGDFDGNKTIASALLAKAVIGSKIKSSDDVMIGIYAGNMSTSLSGGNSSYICHGVVAKIDVAKPEESFQHSYYDIRIEVYIEQVQYPDDVLHN